LVSTGAKVEIEVPEDLAHHFYADASGEILGLTATGRGTVVSLSMNRVLAVRIRGEERSRDRWP
jgi:hypothetical protein